MGHLSKHTATDLSDRPVREALLVGALRCWRAARDQKSPTLTALFSFLALYPQRGSMLAMTLDSLMAIYEAHLRRDLQTGVGNTLSLDEDTLLRLVGLQPSLTAHAFAARAGKRDGLLSCALCSTRIMLSLG